MKTATRRRLARNKHRDKYRAQRRNYKRFWCGVGLKRVAWMIRNGLATETLSYVGKVGEPMRLEYSLDIKRP